MSSAGGLLAACSSSTEVAAPTGTTGTTGEPLGPGGLPLARPDKRVTLPLWEDPIASGLEPETGGTFTVFNYPDYLYKKLLNDFGKKYGVKVQYTAFDNINSGVTAPCLRGRRSGCHEHDAGPARPRGGRKADQAAQPRLHPQPAEERLAGAREPVLRRRLTLHRALHDLCDRDRMAERQGRGRHRFDAAAVGHLLAGGGLQGQGRAPLRESRDDRQRAPPQGARRHQHRRPGARSTRRWPT